MKLILAILVFLTPWEPALSQESGASKKVDEQDTDTTYIIGFKKRNDFRFMYGTKSSTLAYGSKNESGSGASLFNNVNDIVGFGLTYKWIDFDYYFSLPQTKLLPQGIQNLQQFRLSGSYYGRQWTIMGYWNDSRGLVASDASGQFQSTPDIHLLRIGTSFTYNFHYRKYSYKGAIYQNELQRISGGGPLLRIEPYFRKVGIEGTLVPAALDIPQTYGEQQGLAYVNSPGVNILPGYGYTFVFKGGGFFISPYLLAGGGFAVTAYRGRQDEKVILNAELTATGSFNAGYNGARWYAAVRLYYEAHYFNLNPSYFLTQDLKAGITAGYRFGDMERAIPRF